MREARVLRMLAVLDLKSHPPQAGIDEVAVRLDPAPARIVRHSLLTRPLPSPEHVSTLMARLTALLGEGRCGSPVVVDTYRPGAFALEPFRPVDLPEPARPAPVVLSAVIRRFRVPIVVRVELSDGHPHRVWMGGQGTGGDRVRQWSGPWRSSGTWWGQGWDADEWDIELDDGSAYRASCSRQTGRWVIEGVLD
jgi:protein ImuB